MTDEARLEAFQAMAMPLFDPLYNYARWLTRDADEAEDLVQETYLKALRGFDSFAAGTNFRAWIYRILRNTFLTSRSGLRVTSELSFDDDPEKFDVPDDQSPETVYFGREKAGQLQRAIEALPLVFREVLLLADVEELSYREIAEALSIPVGTVTSRLMRARRKVRNAIR